MGTLVTEQVNVGVNVMTESVNFTVNSVFRGVLRIAHTRGLKPDYMIQKREVIENGLFIWLGEQKLVALHLEIFVGGVAIERFDMEFKYRADADRNIRKLDVSGLEEFCRRLPVLPAGVDYRVVVTTADGASDVPGWTPTGLMPLDITNECGLSDFGFGHIGTNLVYRGGRW